MVMLPGGRGFGLGVWRGAVMVALVLAGVLAAPPGQAGAQSTETVVITQENLAWRTSDNGTMTWEGFGSQVSGDPRCEPNTIGGPITEIRFELTFDLSADPPTLTGTLSGAMGWRNPAADDPAYGQEWASGSFSGPIVNGWTRETPEGWEWGGNADLALDFAGLRICSIDLDEWGDEVYLVAEGNGQRQVTAEFRGGAFGGGYHGFELDGFSAPNWEPGQDVWGIHLGCTGCDIPLALPAGSEETPGADTGQEPGGESSVSSAAQPPSAGGEAPAEDGERDDWYTLFSPGGSARRGGWSPLGVLILILLLLALGFGIGSAVPLVLREARSGGAYPLSDTPSRHQAAVMADSARATQAPREPGFMPRFRYVMVSRPVELRLGPDMGAREIGVSLSPGEAYRTVAAAPLPTDVKALPWAPEAWVEVDAGGQRGWVPESALSPFPELPAPPSPPPSR